MFEATVQIRRKPWVQKKFFLTLQLKFSAPKIYLEYTEESGFKSRASKLSFYYIMLK